MVDEDLNFRLTKNCLHILKKFQQKKCEIVQEVAPDLCIYWLHVQTKLPQVCMFYDSTGYGDWGQDGRKLDVGG